MRDALTVLLALASCAPPPRTSYRDLTRSCGTLPLQVMAQCYRDIAAGLQLRDEIKSRDDADYRYNTIAQQLQDQQDQLDYLNAEAAGRP